MRQLLISCILNGCCYYNMISDLYPFLAVNKPRREDEKSLEWFSLERFELTAVTVVLEAIKAITYSLL